MRGSSGEECFQRDHVRCFGWLYTERQHGRVVWRTNARQSSLTSEVHFHNMCRRVQAEVVEQRLGALRMPVPQRSGQQALPNGRVTWSYGQVVLLKTTTGTLRTIRSS